MVARHTENSVFGFQCFQREKIPFPLFRRAVHEVAEQKDQVRFQCVCSGCYFTHIRFPVDRAAMDVGKDGDPEPVESVRKSRDSKRFLPDFRDRKGVDRSPDAKK